MSSQITNILVGVDFSESSERALTHALSLAERISARVDLVYVYDLPVVTVPEMVLPSTYDVSRMAELRKQLKELRGRVIGNKVPSRIHLRVGDPVTGILELAEEVQSDLIVVGSHGRGAVMRALLGSVSERLARRSPVPVLVIPAPGRKRAVEELKQEEPPAIQAGTEIAWSCARCGHIRKRSEAPDRCARCGMEPAAWNSAPVTHEPVDELEPAVGEGAADATEHATHRANQDPAVLFPTSPPGTSGYSVNPELKVRY